MKRAMFLLALELILGLASIDTPLEIEIVVSVIQFDLVEVLM